MICSTDEIGIEIDRAEGIWQISEDIDEAFLVDNIGSPVRDIVLTLESNAPMKYPLRDVVLDLDNKFITNRPDLFGVYGNAREMSATQGISLAPYV